MSNHSRQTDTTVKADIVPNHRCVALCFTDDNCVVVVFTVCRLCLPFRSTSAAKCFTVKEWECVWSFAKRVTDSTNEFRPLLILFRECGLVFQQLWKNCQKDLSQVTCLWMTNFRTNPEQQQSFQMTPAAITLAGDDVADGIASPEVWNQVFQHW